MVSTEAKINKNATSIIPALTPTPDTGHAMDKGFSRKQDHLLYTTLLQRQNYTTIHENANTQLVPPMREIGNLGHTASRPPETYIGLTTAKK